MIEIALIGNERDLLHAQRAMVRYHNKASHQGQQYKFMLFGKFPQEILEGKDYCVSWCGESREECYAMQRHYHLIIDAEVGYNSLSGYSLSQWYEFILGLPPYQKGLPFFTMSRIPHIIQSSYRAARPLEFIGNTVFFMPPSTQDTSWHDVKGRGKEIESWLIYLMEQKYCVAYPQVELKSGASDAFNHQLFFAGSEQTFVDCCYMPKCSTLVDMLFLLLHCRLYVGWNNWIADLAAAMHIPSLLLWDQDWRTSRHCPRTNEYLVRHQYLTDQSTWHVDLFAENLRHLEARAHTHS